jgi:putative flippase GtrA
MSVESTPSAAAQTGGWSLRPHLGRMVRFGLVGGSGAVVNLLILFTLVRFGGWHYLLAAPVAIEASTLSNYMLNRAWTWRDRDRSWWSLLSYHGVTFGGVVVQWTVLWLGVSFFQLHYLLAQALGIALATGWNFVANHKVTFATYTLARKRLHLRVSLYIAAFLLQAALAALLSHDWDTFVFQRSVEQFLAAGITPYQTGMEAPGYTFMGAGIPIVSLWYAYPPLPLLVMSVFYAPAALGMAASPWMGRFLIHIPFVLANLGLAALARHVVSTSGGLANPSQRAAQIERFLLFNPLLIIVATIWGQFEAMLLLALIGSIVALRRERFVLGGAFWGVATLVKIFPLYLGPLLLMHIWRRSGLPAAIRYFATGGAVFVLVSLPFFLSQPSGFLEQVFLMHSSRPPARFSPIAFVYFSANFLNETHPGILPQVEVIIRSLSALSFALTAFVLLALVVAYSRVEASERNLWYFSALSMLVGLLTTKILSEQYSLIPLVLLAIAYYNRVPMQPLSDWFRVKGLLITIPLSLTLAGLIDNVHFLLFLPEDVAVILFGKNVPEVLAAMAAGMGTTVTDLFLASGWIGTLVLIPFFANAFILSFKPVAAGLSVATRWAMTSAARIPAPAHSVRIVAMITIAALLVPPLSIGVLGPKTEPFAEDAGVVEGDWALAYYRSDWLNPTHRLERPAGTWTTNVITPAVGYYSVTTYRLKQDILQMRDMGFSAILVHFNPTHEAGATMARTLGNDIKFPYALEIDLAYAADASGRVPFSERTSATARELFDGPGVDFWRPGYHLRSSIEGGFVLFVKGAHLVGGTYSEEERKFVASQFKDLVGEDLAQAMERSSGRPLWQLTPREEAVNPPQDWLAARWAEAYAAARTVWWEGALQFAGNTTRLDIIADSEVPVPASKAGFVRSVGRYSPDVSDGRPPQEVAAGQLALSRIATRPGDVANFTSSWLQASSTAVDGVLVPWNDYARGEAVEPTQQFGDVYGKRLPVWIQAYLAMGPAAAGPAPYFADLAAAGTSA